MKTKIIALLFASVLVSCSGSKKAIVYDQSRAPLSTNPFGQTYDMPLFEADTDDYFAAVGTATGAKAQMGVLQLNALSNAQAIVRQKMKHAYQGMVSDYTNSMGINNASDIASKIERGGDHVIDVIVNDTQAIESVCKRNSKSIREISKYEILFLCSFFFVLFFVNASTKTCVGERLS